MDHPAAHERLRGVIGRPGPESPEVTGAFGIAVHREGCVTHHVRDALRAGATREEVVEPAGVGVTGGGPATVHGAEAVEALDRLGAAGS